MRPHSLLFSRGGLASALALLLGSGAVLILSMPWAGRVGDFFLFPWRPSPLAFLLGLAFFLAVFAANRGSAVEPLPWTQRRQLASLPFQVLFASILITPYVSLGTVLLASKKSVLWLAWAYLILVSLFIAVGAFQIERTCVRRGLHSFFPRAGFVAVYFGFPFLALLFRAPASDLASISPVILLWRLLTPPTAAQWGWALAVPVAGTAWIAWRAMRGIRKEHHASRT